MTTFIAISNNINMTTLGFSMFMAGIILGMSSANERQHYNITSPLIGWVHTRDILYIRYSCTIVLLVSSVQLPGGKWPGILCIQTEPSLREQSLLAYLHTRQNGRRGVKGVTSQLGGLWVINGLHVFSLQRADGGERKHFVIATSTLLKLSEKHGGCPPPIVTWWSLKKHQSPQICLSSYHWSTQPGVYF